VKLSRILSLILQAWVLLHMSQQGSDSYSDEEDQDEDFFIENVPNTSHFDKLYLATMQLVDFLAGATVTSVHATWRFLFRREYVTIS